MYIPYYYKEYGSWRNRCCSGKDSTFRIRPHAGKLAVLGDTYQRLADTDVVPFFHQQILHITADGRNNRLAACRMVLCDCLVTDTGIFINLFGLREFLSDTIVAYECFHTLIFLLETS